ncbi:hypothetical protein NSK_004573 [Nannochloropsis salina CCMP1776]|uniref:Uncharacterized protein n=1 Tax=Nannochloropsis salina CCMP1776 TaxID=1027361 RepID=A0A4D9CXV5_9STRA|nr:hypothetical protein NSK_004573 [Nannochloropsis salina CCMP1776]|eukprot:TFJ84100.1 hypothetical protein NSK_004573 [Nannochloropsis salina CCMP1776]
MWTEWSRYVQEKRNYINNATSSCNVSLPDIKRVTIASLTDPSGKEAGCSGMTPGASPSSCTGDVNNATFTAPSRAASDILISPLTKVSYVYQSQSIVFCLHISQSLFCFQGEIIPAELMESSLACALKNLVEDTKCCVLDAVEILVTVLACNVERQETQTMVQGYPLCRGSIQGLLDRLGPFLAQVENKLAGCKVRDEGMGLESVAEELPPSSAFEELIAVSIFALQMMPADAAPSIVLVVDGVFDMGVAAVAEHDDVVMQLCRDDIVLSVLCIAPLQEPNTALGYVGDVVALENVVKTTKGCLMGAMDGGQKVAVLANCSSSEGPRYMLACGGKKDPQYLRECILLRDSRLSCPLDVKAARVKRDSDLSASALPKLLPSTLSSTAVQRLELKKYCLPLMCLQMLLELRTAEGFHMTAFRVASSPKHATNVAIRAGP